MATKKTKTENAEVQNTEVVSDENSTAELSNVTEGVVTAGSWSDFSVEQTQITNTAHRKHIMFQPEIDIEYTHSYRLKHATDGSAGYDVHAAIDEPIKLIRGGRAQLIPLGFKMHIADPNFVAVLVARSGNGHKRGLVMGNGSGIIDSDYLGNVYVSAWARPNRTQWTATHENDFIDGDTPEYILINPGDRIGQILFMPVAHPIFKEVPKLEANTTRGEGGFSSTGTK